jgi:hypothetical protein
MIEFLLGIVGSLIAAAIYSWATAWNWRQTLDRMSRGDGVRQHRRLSALIVNAVNHHPQYLTGAFSRLLFAGMLGALVLTFSCMSTWVQSSLSNLNQLGRDSEKAIATLQGKSEPPQTTEELVTQLTDGIRTLGRASIPLTITKWVSIVASIGFLVVAIWFIGVFLPRDMLSLHVSIWLDIYANRLLAMATKDEARQASILELAVVNEATLRAYLQHLRSLSTKYEFWFIPQLMRWLETSERLAA